ncbi:unnamed protein product [Lactuca virosa]|uniref:Uncharacterized protein n=1 Tax=Lactuca virosa TaxID=75947 RepID=A0AAU9PXU2_9ASTR|nr:unnamed protein product [Lactuca virosa]
MEENFNNIKEVKAGQRDHVSSRSGKGRVDINSENVLGEKLKPVFERLNEITIVMRSTTSSQQRGEPDVNIDSPYQTGFIKKTSDADSIKLEKRPLEEKFKNIKEVKTSQRDHVSSGSGKGRVNINSKKVTEDDPTLTQKEKN